MEDLFIKQDVKLIGSLSDLSYPQHGYMYVSDGIIKSFDDEIIKKLGSELSGKTSIQIKFIRKRYWTT